MPKSKIDKRLMRLISSGIRPKEDSNKYAAELKQFADTVARADEAEKEAKFSKR